MKFPECQFGNREMVKFCEECGAKFELSIHRFIFMKCVTKLYTETHNYIGVPSFRLYVKNFTLRNKFHMIERKIPGIQFL